MHHHILDTRISILWTLFVRPSRLCYPPWIPVRGWLESSGQRLISSIGIIMKKHSFSTKKNISENSRFFHIFRLLNLLWTLLDFLEFICIFFRLFEIFWTFWDFFWFSEFVKIFRFLGFFVFIVFFFLIFWLFSKLLRLLLKKVTEVTTEHQKWPEISTNSVTSFFFFFA